MYAVNTTGEFVKNVVANGTGWYERGEGGEYNTPVKPMKLALNDNRYHIVYKNQYSSSIGRWYLDYYFMFKGALNTSRATNSGGAVIEAFGDGTPLYTLTHEGGKYIVLDGTSAASYGKP